MPLRIAGFRRLHCWQSQHIEQSADGVVTLVWDDDVPMAWDDGEDIGIHDEWRGLLVDWRSAWLVFDDGAVIEFA